MPTQLSQPSRAMAACYASPAGPTCCGGHRRWRGRRRGSQAGSGATCA
jgi:hypothetical protein